MGALEHWSGADQTGRPQHAQPSSGKDVGAAHPNAGREAEPSASTPEQAVPTWMWRSEGSRSLRGTKRPRLGFLTRPEARSRARPRGTYECIPESSPATSIAFVCLLRV